MSNNELVKRLREAALSEPTNRDGNTSTAELLEEAANRLESLTPVRFKDVSGVLIEGDY